MNKKTLRISLGLLAVFAIWTIAVSRTDVAPIGPQGANVGFATLNRFFHDFTGVHMQLYVLTDYLGLIPLFFILGFAILGLVQWIRRKHLRKVDLSLLVLGGLFLVVLAAYGLFEILVINYRPVLIGGLPEASYPSSTTMLVMCVMLTARLQLKDRIQNRNLSLLITVCTIFMVLGRLLSGVHRLTDIIGGCLLSAGLALLYHALSNRKHHAKTDL